MINKWLSLLLVLCLTVGCFTACGETAAPAENAESAATAATDATEALVEYVDYAGSLELDMTSNTAKEEVTVKQFIDGDTTHFYVSQSVRSSGVLKGRYLAINTPESTGKIEEWGKAASSFTKEKLASATSIIIESDNSTWNTDSTGERVLIWVWYKPSGSDSYRNLNIEILQNGLAIANNSAGNRYGDTAVAAINQAKAQKLCVHSGEKDPDFYYGEAIELTLKELRTNIDQYNGMRVAFHGMVTTNDSNTVYVESYDPETDMYYGMAVYYGYNLQGAGLDVLSIGNEVRIVGSVQYYEAGGTYQVSDLNYRAMKPDDPNNIQKLSEGNAAAYKLIDANTFVNGTVSVEREEGTTEELFAAMSMNASVELQNLRVVDIYTTSKEDSASKGAMTLTCLAVDGTRISVRTAVLYDENGNLVTQDAYIGKTVDVRGIVDYYSGNYQIKVFEPGNIIVR